MQVVRQNAFMRFVHYTRTPDHWNAVARIPQTGLLWPGMNLRRKRDFAGAENGFFPVE